MRVITGSAKGIKLYSPIDDITRPTLDKSKEALFSIINYDIEGTRFLDVFSGSGSIGIEALSRGANTCYFIESNRVNVALINKNLKHTRLSDRGFIIPFDYRRAIKKLHSQGLRFDYIFMDPPYNKGFITASLECLSKFNVLTESGSLISETSNNEVISNTFDFEPIRTKRYRESSFIFYKAAQL
jgi:16S rRNA (guanine(966)-N(2))-methyltransferase RsmD